MADRNAFDAQKLGKRGVPFEKSSSTNWIFNLQKSILKLISAGHSSKNPVGNRLKISFIEINFTDLIFQKSSTDG